MRLDKAKDCSIQKYLGTPSKYGILVQFETRSRGLLFYQTRSHAIVLYGILQLFA